VNKANLCCPLLLWHNHLSFR